MVIIVNCKNCGKDSTPVGKASANIHLGTLKDCHACLHTHEENNNLHFCCVDCLIAWVQKNPDQLRIEARLLEEGKHQLWRANAEALRNPNAPAANEDVS